MKWALQVFAVGLLMLTSGIGYASLYGSPSYRAALLVAALCGLSIGSLFAFALPRSIPRWSGLLTATILLVVVTAAAWVAVRPGKGALSLLSDLAHGFQAILIANQPVDVTNSVLIVPFAVTALGAFLGAASVDQPTSFMPLVGPGIAWVIQLLLSGGAGTEHQVVVSTASFALGTALLAGLPHPVHLRAAQQQTSRHQTSRLISQITLITLLTSGIAVGTGLASQGSALSGGGSPYDPREHWLRTTPATQQVTPLEAVKAGLTGPDTTQFAVRFSGPAAPPDRMGIAVLDDYDGSTWTVRPDLRIAGRVLRRTVAGAEQQIRAEVQVESLTGLLLPTASVPISLERTAGTEAQNNIGAQNSDVWFDSRHDLVQARSDPRGWQYRTVGVSGTEVTSALPRAERQDDLLLPRSASEIRALAADWLPAGKSTSRADLDHLARTMQSFPYSPGAPAGNSLADLHRVLSGRLPINSGYSEQHAAAFSLLARASGLPARVVVGYLLPERVSGAWIQVSAHDIHAWSQVFINGEGWVTFDPTDVHRTVTPYPATQVAVTAPPPPTPTVRPAPTVTPTSQETATPPVPCDTAFCARVELHRLWAVAITLLAVLAIAAVLAGYLALARRHRRRRARVARSTARRSGTPAQRVLGAWAETVDLLRERQVPVRPSSTPDEVVLLSEPLVADSADPVARMVALVNARFSHPTRPARQTVTRHGRCTMRSEPRRRAGPAKAGCHEVADEASVGDPTGHPPPSGRSRRARHHRPARTVRPQCAEPSGPATGAELAGRPGMAGH